MSDIHAQYAGFLRSVIRSGETLPDDYDIESFKAKMMNAIDCYDVHTGNKIGVSSVKHEVGEDAYFGNDIYNCVASGEILLFRFCV